jgi:hypothetical protein
MPAEPDLTELQRALLDCVMDAAEPTWIMLKEIPEAHGDRELLERALADLESRGLLLRTRELSFDPDAADVEVGDWWALTDAGWEFLGETKPLGYHLASIHRGGV